MATELYTPQAYGAQLIIVDSEKMRICNLEDRPQWIIGRFEPQSGHTPDIPLLSRLVSREHGAVWKHKNTWYYQDSPRNTNGTFYNERKLPRDANGLGTPVPLKDGDILRVDNADLQHHAKGGVLLIFSTAPTRGQWATMQLHGKESILIGRHPACDIVVPFPYFSGKHARLTLHSGQYFLSDCGSRAGTYLNGRKVTGRVPLQDRDCFFLCDQKYIFLQGMLIYVKHAPGRQIQPTIPKNVGQRNVILKADIATKRVKNNSGSGTKELIRDIHLEIREGTLVALLGTAGAGKSTVMNCLNGMDLEGVQGSVTYRGVELMNNFEQMKHLIGSVPQKKTFHRTFTPEQEFTYAAIKRLPADTTPQEIQQRVDTTLEMLSMTQVRKNKNCKLSGGEQTRVNVGIELVADRDLLCLDEPDQGLSPNYKHELFRIMRDLAHKNGKSVLTIIHDVSEIDMFDQVIMLVKADGVGRLAFSGTPAEAKQYFGVDIRDAYALLEREPHRFVR